MRKLILSLVVVFVIAVYSLYEQQKSGGNTAVVNISPSISPNKSGASSSSSINYKDGEYTGSTADAFYGYIQVKAIIQGGKIADVKFLRYPNDSGNSVEINQQAMPLLRQEAIQTQSSHVDIVSGATNTSEAFQQSLQSALTRAKQV